MIHNKIPSSNNHILLFLTLGFYVQFFGQGKSQWTKESGESSTTYTGLETYIYSRSYLFGEYGGHKLKLNAGTYRYKFSSQLPYKIPYSLKLGNGTISYHVEAVLNIPWKIDKKAKKHIIVLRYDDLNFYPELKTPLICIERKSFLSLLSASELDITVKLAYTGYAIDECAHMLINYENNSSIDIIGTKIKLIQLVTFNSPLQMETKVKDAVVGEARFEGVRAGSSKCIQAGIKIPKVMTSNEKFCQVIIIKYLIEIEAEASGMRTNAKVRLPITIGTAPLIFENETSRMMQPSEPVEEPGNQESRKLTFCSFY